jgi:hypothetical protein
MQEKEKKTFASKEEEIKDFLDRNKSYFQKKYENKKNLLELAKLDVFKQVLGYFNRNDWKKTYNFVLDKYRLFLKKKKNNIFINTRHAYEQIYFKMRKIEKQEEKKSRAVKSNHKL